MKNPSAIMGLALIVVLCLLSAFAHLITAYSYAFVNIADALAPPSPGHIFGTDDMGRDIFTRIIYGGRYSITLGLFATLLAVVIGGVIGSVSGFYGGRVDNGIMRFMDIIQSMPSLLFAIMLSAVLGTGYAQTIVALGVASVPGIARMMRANILSVRGMEYIEAARSIKCSDGRIILRHVVPNALSPMIVTTANQISSNILSATGLSFIGLGIQPPTPEWGAMLTGGRSYIMSAPHLVLFPGVFICLFTMGFNLFGDALRDALDPTLKN
jgi:peptide/nickel transport system permease protein